MWHSTGPDIPPLPAAPATAIPRPSPCAGLPVSHPPAARRQLALIAAAMVLGMTPWFSATIAAPLMLRAWGAAGAVATWLTIAVQIGFVIGTAASAVLLLADRFQAPRLAGWSAVAAALFTAALALPGAGPVSALWLRLLTGAALAGVYPPGIKLVAGWWRERRGTAIGVLVGALTLGSAAPNLFRLGAAHHAWRPVVLLAAAAALGSAALFLGTVREGPYHAPSPRFEPAAAARVAREPGVALATGGYLGHMWELYAMWSSIPLFWGAMAARHQLRPAAAPLLAFATIASGTAGCIAAGVLADRLGRARVTIWAMVISGACALSIGPATDRSLALAIAVALVWGATIVADSAQFSACVTELAPPSYVGTAVTLQTCLGFLLTIVSIRLVPAWAERWGWTRAYMPLAIGPALGTVAMWTLRRRAAG